MGHALGKKKQKTKNNFFLKAWKQELLLCFAFDQSAPGCLNVITPRINLPEKYEHKLVPMSPCFLSSDPDFSGHY